ncbi:MAG TPA: cupredoxin domain-containing protein [Candidatus Limnocylindrales bacterium]|nr:cupredoxin domain-containing protein [Candidatus Limnocylindrales bacterium]
MKRLTLTLGLLTLAAALAACSNTSAAPASTDVPAGAPAGDAATLTAKDFKFTESQVTVPADEAFELTFDNQDGAPHNVAIYTDSSASTKVSVGEIFGGPGQKTQSVPALAAGTYFFRCDVHPDMQGTLVAE